MKKPPVPSPTYRAMIPSRNPFDLPLAVNYNSTMSVILHADDFGITRSATQGILSAWADDALDRFGIMANGRHCDWGCRLLSTMNRQPLRLSIHLDLVEGCPLSDPAYAPQLHNPTGHFPFTFRTLMHLQSQAPESRQELSRQISEEWRQQILRSMALFPTTKVWSLDAHHHVHIIPWLWEIVFKLARQFSIAEIRIPRDQITLFMKQTQIYHWSGLFNQLRARRINRLIGQNFYHKLYSPLFVGGVLFEGIMYRFPFHKIRDNLTHHAEEIEILFHPGDESPDSPDDRLANPGFFRHPARHRELQALLELKKKI